MRAVFAVYMFRYIENLQQASLGKRKTVTLAVSAFATLVIFGFWLVTFTHTEISVVASTVLQKKEVSPFSSMMATVKGIFDGSTSVYERP